MYRTLRDALSALVIGLSAQGCGDDAAGNGAAGMAGGGPGDPNGFAAIYEDILLPSCAAVTCHGSNAGNLDMSTPVFAYMSLVNAPATGPSCSGMGFTRVRPGDSTTSLLVTKLDVTAPPCGAAMPIAGMLPTADVARISAWIDSGAPNN